ncbi:hypothetical protein ACVIW2_005060 [Bradyrhizobium huanghuaihaiense]
MTAPSAAELMRLVEALSTGAELNDEQRAAAADVLRQLTLPPARHAEQDALIVKCRETFFVDLGDRKAAVQIEIGLNRYAASAWSRDRTAEKCPLRLVDKVTGAYWRILKASPRQPSAERIRKILSKSRGLAGSV